MDKKFGGPPGGGGKSHFPKPKGKTSVSQKGKRKTRPRPFSSSATLQPESAHLQTNETKRNDFPVGLFPPSFDMDIKNLNIVKEYRGPSEGLSTKCKENCLGATPKGPPTNAKTKVSKLPKVVAGKTCILHFAFSHSSKEILALSTRGGEGPWPTAHNCSEHGIITE